MPDSAGAGYRRGGTGYRKRYRVLVDATLNYRKAPTGEPQGVFGGKSPQPWECTLRPDTAAAQPMRNAGAFELTANETFEFQAQGGAGYRGPRTPEPDLLLQDVLNGLVSVEAAEHDYAVAINPQTFTIDHVRTAALRA